MKCDKTPKQKARTFVKVIFWVALILFVGTLGFVVYEGSSWVNSFQNAAFILTTTGMVHNTKTYSGKIYSSIYNIFASLFAILIISLLFTSAIEKDITGGDDGKNGKNH